MTDYSKTNDDAYENLEDSDLKNNNVKNIWWDDNRYGS